MIVALFRIFFRVSEVANGQLAGGLKSAFRREAFEPIQLCHLDSLLPSFPSVRNLCPAS